MGSSDLSKNENNQPLSPTEQLAAKDYEDSRVQVWKGIWPPTQAVTPIRENGAAGQTQVLHQGGGAYPNFIKATEGVRL